MTRARRLCLAVSLLLVAGCDDGNAPPSLALILDQRVTVGETLRLVISARDPDGDRLTFSASGLPPTAELVARADDEALLLYSPSITDTQPGGRRYEVTVEVADGRGGVARQRFGLLVFPTFGVPSFDLPTGVALNLAQRPDLELLVVVKDDDSTDVLITFAEAPAGARLDKVGPKRALLRWRPDEHQREIAVHRFVLQAQDESHAPVTHVLSVVIINAEPQAGCPGTPPTVLHQALPDQTGGEPIVLALHATDAESLIQSAAARWTVGDPHGPYQVALMDQAEGSSSRWETELQAASVASPGVLLHYTLSATDNDDPTGIACDHTAHHPKAGWHTLALTAPGAPPGHCVDDPAEPDGTQALAPTLGPGLYPGRRMCGADVDLVRIDTPRAAWVAATVRWEPSHGDLTLRLVDLDGAPLAQGAEAGPGALRATYDREAPTQVFAEIRGAGPQVRLSYTLELHVSDLPCPDDAFAPNATPAQAAPIAHGVYPELRLCSGASDYFRVPTSAQTPVRVAIAFEHRYGDLDLELLTLDGRTVLARSASERSGEALLWSGAGEVLARVYGVGGATNTYALTVESAAPLGPCPRDLLGDNHRPERAITLFQGVYDGFIVCALEPDWFAVDLNGGETLTVLVEAADPAAPVTIAIYEDPTAAPVAVSELAAADLSEASHTLGPHPGRLYYRLSTTSAVAPYALLQHVDDPPGPCAPDRFEPNSPSSPAALGLGVHTWARLCSDAELDAYAFTVPPLARIIALTRHAPGQGYTDLRLLGPDGAEVARALDLHVGASLDVQVQFGGTYVLVVEPEGAAPGLRYDFAIFVD